MKTKRWLLKKGKNKIMEACKRRAKFASKLYGSGSSFFSHGTPHVHASFFFFSTKENELKFKYNLQSRGKKKKSKG